MVFDYPVARKENLTETIHGIKITDPYRWLEDLDSDETKQFVQQQQNLTESYLKDAPNREEIRKSLKEMSNYEKFTCPFKVGDNYYYFHNNGLDNQDIMYVLKDLNDSEPKIFLDPNELSEDATSSINTFEFSDDCKWFAYAISDGGSDWLRIKIRNVQTGQDLEEEIDNCRFTNILWTKDNLGFFYGGYLPDKEQNDSKAKQNHKIFYHKLHTHRSEDFIAIEYPNSPNTLILGRMSDCGKFLHIQLNDECRNVRVHYSKFDLPLAKGKLSDPIPIVDKIEAEYDYLANDGCLVYYRTNKNAPNFKISRFNLNGDLDEKNIVDVIREHEHNVLNKAFAIDNDKLLLIYLKDVKQTIEMRQLKDGKLIKTIDLPIGCVRSVECNRKSSELFFQFESFLTPGIIYNFDLKNKNEELKIFKEIKLKNFDSSNFVVKQIFYDAKNGFTKIPMFIVHSKNLELNSQNLTYLYAYGGFNIAILPTFDLSKILLINNFRGVYALANVRGGGEYGSKWYQAGSLLNKQNTLDDIQNAGECLIKENYTNNQLLTIEGISNGGLMMQICSNQRPDLFGCVITRVGAHDLLRYDKFTLGYLWKSDLGSTSNKMHFMNLYKLTPLYNIPINCEKYPATLILTADHDDRVVPSHSYKLAAHLQDKLGKHLNETPLLLRVDINAGHCDGKSVSKEIDEITDIYSFIQKSLKIKFHN